MREPDPTRAVVVAGSRPWHAIAAGFLLALLAVIIAFPQAEGPAPSPPQAGQSAEAITQGDEALISTKQAAPDGPSRQAVPHLHIAGAPKRQVAWLALRSSVDGHVFSTLPTPDGTASFDMPGDHVGCLELVSDNPESGILLEPLPIESAPASLSVDLARLARLDVELTSWAATAEWVEISVALQGQPRRLRRLIPVDRRLVLLSGSMANVQCFGQIGRRVELVDVGVAKSRFTLDGHQSVRLTTRTPRGMMRLTQGHLPVTVPFSFGVAGGRALADVAVEQGPIGLSDFQRDGHDGLWFWAEPYGLFFVALTDLRHEADGTVLVEAPSGTTGTLLIRADTPCSEWRIIVSPATTPAPYVVALRHPDAWTLPLLPGAYRLFWVKNDAPPPARTISIPGEFVVRAGSTTEVEVQCPRILEVHLRVTNWSRIPTQLRPTWVDIDGAPCKKFSGDGEFTAVVMRHAANSVALFRPLRVKAVARWDGDELRVEFPLHAIGSVQIRPILGGVLRVSQCRNADGRVEQARCPVAGASGQYYFLRDDPVILVIEEQVAGRRHCMGVYEVAESQAEVLLAGRWIEVQNDISEPVDLVATFPRGFAKLERNLASCAPGMTRVWVPDDIAGLSILRAGMDPEPVEVPESGVLIIRK